MPLTVPSVAEELALRILVNNIAAENLVLRLFVNNITINEGVTLSSFTEASGFGYVAVNVPSSGWTFVAGDPTVATCAPQSFTFTGALGNVYGYFVTQVVSGKLMWAERFFDGPYLIVNNGDQINVTLKISGE